VWASARPKRLSIRPTVRIITNSGMMIMRAGNIRTSGCGLSYKAKVTGSAVACVADASLSNSKTTLNCALTTQRPLSTSSSTECSFPTGSRDHSARSWNTTRPSTMLGKMVVDGNAKTSSTPQSQSSRPTVSFCGLPDRLAASTKRLFRVPMKFWCGSGHGSDSSALMIGQRLFDRASRVATWTRTAVDRSMPETRAAMESRPPLETSTLARKRASFVKLISDSAI